MTKKRLAILASIVAAGLMASGLSAHQGPPPGTRPAMIELRGERPPLIMGAAPRPGQPIPGAGGPGGPRVDENG